MCGHAVWRPVVSLVWSVLSYDCLKLNSFVSDSHIVQLSVVCTQLDNITHKTTTTSAHRSPTFTVHDYNITISAFQVTRKDTGHSLQMVYVGA
jgi:hypothetical protein